MSRRAGKLSPCYLPNSLVGGSRIRFVVRVGLMSDRLVEERLSRIAEQVAQAQRNSEVTERVREQADSLEVEGTSKGGEVTVVVDAAGRVRDVRFTAASQVLSPSQLSAAVMEAIDTGRRDAATRSARSWIVISVRTRGWARRCWRPTSRWPAPRWEPPGVPSRPRRAATRSAARLPVSSSQACSPRWPITRSGGSERAGRH